MVCSKDPEDVMEVLTWSRAVDELAKALNKWVLYLSYSSGELPDIEKAAPIGLSKTQLIDLYIGQLWIIFDNEKDALEAFGKIVGDDGPTKTNPYNGPGRVYSLLSGPNGGITENT